MARIGTFVPARRGARPQPKPPWPKETRKGSSGFPGGRMSICHAERSEASGFRMQRMHARHALAGKQAHPVFAYFLVRWANSMKLDEPEGNRRASPLRLVPAFARCFPDHIMGETIRKLSLFPLFRLFSFFSATSSCSFLAAKNLAKKTRCRAFAVQEPDEPENS
jgi:hypothetical protein